MRDATRTPRHRRVSCAAGSGEPAACAKYCTRRPVRNKAQTPHTRCNIQPVPQHATTTYENTGGKTNEVRKLAHLGALSGSLRWSHSSLSAKVESSFDKLFAPTTESRFTLLRFGDFLTFQSLPCIPPGLADMSDFAESRVPTPRCASVRISFVSSRTLHCLLRVVGSVCVWCMLRHGSYGRVLHLVCGVCAVLRTGCRVQFYAHTVGCPLPAARRTQNAAVPCVSCCISHVLASSCMTSAV